MKHLVVSTFDPQKLPYGRYAIIFQEMFRHFNAAGISVEILPPPDTHDLKGTLVRYKEKLAEAEMIFHISGYAWYQLSLAFEEERRTSVLEMLRARGYLWLEDFDIYNEKTKEKIKNFVYAVNQYIKDRGNSGVLLNADVYLKEEKEAYDLLDENTIPRVPTLQIEAWEKNKIFPVVFKQKNTTKGEGVYFIENEAQFSTLSPIKDTLSLHHFIECPGDHYTHYRIFTIGSGNILAAVLSYSQMKKGENRRIIDREGNNPSGRVYDNSTSAFFINRKQITSNRSAGGKQIPLEPNEKSKRISDHELSILNDHGITNQYIPEILKKQAQKTAEIFAKKGLFILGQDWIQSKDGVFYCLELNWGPERGCFDTAYNLGKGEDDVALIIAAEKIAEGILGAIKK
ncbi:MAG: hypothetical protein AABX82_06030 [Nanoarchaeota archaeon]